jgi:hypothetical protein
MSEYIYVGSTVTDDCPECGGRDTMTVNVERIRRPADATPGELLVEGIGTCKCGWQDWRRVYVEG